MSTFKKTMLTAAITAAGVVGVTAGTAAQAQVSASVGIANIYFWRGFDLGAGSAAVSGSLDYASDIGIYAGIWGSSGDDTYGTEYDLYVGYGGSAGDWSWDVSYWDYNYPDGRGADDLEEFSLGLGYGPVSYYVMIPVKYGIGDGDYGEYMYHNVSADLGSGFSAAIGTWTGDFNGENDIGETVAASADGTHFDLSYTVSDVSFTISVSTGDDYQGENDDGEFESNDPIFVVSYSLPLDM